ncbi:MAG: uspA [Gammaproteobacteria bacterium]|nr:uspA [Gammaproteobacteria bacterium]
MVKYKHILVAVELDPTCDNIAVKRALALSKVLDAKVTLVHAVEHMSSYGAAYGIAVGADVEEMLIENAQKAMDELGDKLGVPESHRIIKMGPAKLVILAEAEELKVDLIVVGSHGRHGIRLLLGSTANAVIHGAKCDVLAVRIVDGEKK